MKAIVASAWLAVLLASAFLAASDDAGAASVAAAAQPAAERPSRADEEGYSISRTSWPKVVGMPSSEVKKICGDRSSCAWVHVIPPGYAVTMDYRGVERVRVFVDSNDKVVTVPRIG